MPQPAVVLELYSGLGGHRVAARLLNEKLSAADQHPIISSDSVFHGLDVNEQANRVYNFNFADHPASASDIAMLTAARLDVMRPDIVLMSPPCQPYSKNGLRMQSKDARAESFIVFLEQLPLMTAPMPSHILLENVLGFEASDTFARACAVLESLEYTIQSYIVNPIELGMVPNSRPRFYMLAKKGAAFALPQNNNRHDNSALALKALPLLMWSSQSPVSPPLLSHFIDECADTDDSLNVPHRALWKAGDQMDIVRAHTHARSCCFTKGYGAHARGAGSVLSMARDDEIIRAAAAAGYVPVDSTDDDAASARCRVAQVDWDTRIADPRVLRAMSWMFARYFERRAEAKPVPQALATSNENNAKKRHVSAKKRLKEDMERGSWPDTLEECPLAALRLRYFSPREVARLLGFPEWYSFPKDMTNSQCWKLLGNSVNVIVVALMLEYLLK
ncbi:tRNA (cytosine-5-)-methyltransferase [Entophlyctis luteolus]|nr:tRNA (cytosine-5-)-methyltransferase [Entophlyctis luteolus]